MDQQHPAENRSRLLSGGLRPATALALGISCSQGSSGPSGGKAPSPFAGALSGAGDADGTGPGGRFWSPNALAQDGQGNLYVADSSNNTIRKVTPAGSANGAGSAATFNLPFGLAFNQGFLYVADSNNTVRKVDPSGAVTTLPPVAGGSKDDLQTVPATLFQPVGIVRVPL
jgi:hypothetical protein